MHHCIMGDGKKGKERFFLRFLTLASGQPADVPSDANSICNESPTLTGNKQHGQETGKYTGIRHKPNLGINNINLKPETGN